MDKEKRANQLFGWTKNWEARGEIIDRFTHGRTRSMRYMDELQLDRMIKWLEDRNQAMNKMKQKCWVLTRQRGWRLPNGKADMQRLDQFLLSSGAIRKPLKEQDYDELLKTTNQLERICR